MRQLKITAEEICFWQNKPNVTSSETTGKILKLLKESDFQNFGKELLLSEIKTSTKSKSVRDSPSKEKKTIPAETVATILQCRYEC